MRRTKLLLWGPVAITVVIDFFAMTFAGIISNTLTSNETLVSLVWWAWLFLFTLSLVLLGCWVAYWRRLPPTEERP
ncbi:hypothetical protein [Actinomadura sp. 7K534]|uniref:hypothetical protein n=1 Tax=Actinomadura sp. 7K534 TaxID=2530366 RepID=UPI00104A451E|nr:hypothetical protein [Actinomadura sp. 7K534]TDB88432.1 hypothetical protein E1266_31290 [Actinomadura sp. 7K534]